MGLSRNLLQTERFIILRYLSVLIKSIGSVRILCFFSKKIIYVAIGNKKSISHHLKKVTSRTFYVTKDFISDCVL